MGIIFTDIDFIRESNRIEGIHREPESIEIFEHRRLMALETISVPEMERFVKAYQPDAILRDRPGLDVQVGSYLPPRGDVTVKTRLRDILSDAKNWRGVGHAYAIHVRYEQLHPFTDGNGRSGRALWMWMMKSAPLGFLHTWYYQSLEHMENKR